jgi:ribose 5-phosphate isomerase B
MKPLKEIRIAICNDHAGYELKTSLVKVLQNEVEEITDFGSYSTESCDYPDFGHKLAVEVEKGYFDFGISICGTGNGINMTVNKHQGIRSALCWNNEIAALARQHNNANVIALPGRFISEQEAIDMVHIFLNTDFEGGRHEKRVEKIACR